jgi:hypothetical protein
MHFSGATLLVHIISFASLSTQSSLPRTVFQFPNPTWIENIASTRNGLLLVSILGPPELHAIDPFATSNSTATDTLLFTFPGVTTVSGITEYKPDVFVVGTGNYSLTAGETPGASIAWRVDLSSGKAKVEKIADLRRTQYINGLAALSDGIVFMADSAAGNIVRLDVESGEYDVVIEGPAVAANRSASFPGGVNGMKVVGSTLYFTNQQLGTVNRVDVDKKTGRAVGPIVTVANISGIDDLAVTDDGTAFVARPLANVVERASTDGHVPIAGGQDSLEVAGVTAATLGRTWRDRGVLYVSTMGGVPNGGADGFGEFLEGGKVVALSLNEQGGAVLDFGWQLRVD